MSLNFEEINILGNIINDTFGKGSTNYEDGISTMGGYTRKGVGQPSSVVTKSALSGNILTVTSLSIINLTSPSTQHQQIVNCENELNQYVKKYITNIKKEFKKKEKDGGAGRALKCKQVKNSERNSVEMINHYNENRPAIVRRSIDFEVG